MLEQLPETVTPVATLLTIALILVRELVAAKRSPRNDEKIMECLRRLETSHEDTDSKFATTHCARATDLERVERKIDSCILSINQRD